MSEVRDEIRLLAGDVGRIELLHQQALAAAGSSQVTAALDAQTAATQRRTASIRDRIKELNLDRVRTPVGGAARDSKDRQVEQLKRDFSRELEAYRGKELAYRTRYRDQIARQYRIVNPDATEDEVRPAVEADWGNEGVFQAAVSFPRCIVIPRTIISTCKPINRRLTQDK